MSLNHDSELCCLSLRWPHPLWRKVEATLEMAKLMTELMKQREEEAAAKLAMIRAQISVVKDAMKAATELKNIDQQDAGIASQEGLYKSARGEDDGAIGSAAAAGTIANATDAFDSAGNASTTVVNSAAATSHNAAVQAALMAKAGLAAAATRNSALSAAIAAAHAQVAAQGPSIPTLEKSLLAGSAAAAAETVVVARLAAEEAQVAAMLAAAHTIALAKQASGTAALAAAAAHIAASRQRAQLPPVGDVVVPAVPLSLDRTAVESLSVDSAESMSLLELTAWAASRALQPSATEAHSTQLHALAAEASRNAAAAVASAVMAVHSIAEAVGDCTLVDSEGLRGASPADLDALARSLRGLVEPARDPRQQQQQHHAPLLCVAGGETGTAFLELLALHAEQGGATQGVGAATDRPLPPGRAGVFHAAKRITDSLEDLSKVGYDFSWDRGDLFHFTAPVHVCSRTLR